MKYDDTPADLVQPRKSQPRKMSRSRLPVLLVLLAVSLLVLASCQPLPVVVPVTKDPATSLYTIPFYDGANLVVDIAGPLVWSTCQRGHLPAELPCKSDTCKLANAYPVPGCRAAGCGHDARKDRTSCTANPYNPVTGACAAGSLVHTRFVANTTDGKNPVSQVSVRTVAACGTTKKLLASLPRGASGVAGLAGSGLALPAQVASSQKVAKKFLLCLPTGGANGDGVAIFGGSPLYLQYTGSMEYTESLQYTPLVARKDSPAHYVTVNYIAFENSRRHGAQHDGAIHRAPARRVPPVRGRVRQGRGGAVGVRAEAARSEARAAVWAVLRRADAGQHAARLHGTKCNAGA
uniref:Uncharacterized protein n=1 Tax=Avena sativa TaxID=4498 RepID=A0ACD5XFS0_AVESA